RAALGVAVEFDLEQRPADVEHDRAIPAEDRLAWLCRLAQPATLPGGLVHVPAEDIGRPFKVRGTRLREIQERRARPDRSHVERVATLVEELEQVPGAALGIRCEDPWRPWRPGTGRRLVGGPGTHAEGERDGDRGPAAPGPDVVGEPEIERIG